MISYSHCHWNIQKIQKLLLTYLDITAISIPDDAPILTISFWCTYTRKGIHTYITSLLKWIPSSKAKRKYVLFDSLVLADTCAFAVGSHVSSTWMWFFSIAVLKNQLNTIPAAVENGRLIFVFHSESHDVRLQFYFMLYVLVILFYIIFCFDFVQFFFLSYARHRVVELIVYVSSTRSTIDCPLAPARCRFWGNHSQFLMGEFFLYLSADAALMKVRQSSRLRQ